MEYSRTGTGFVLAVLGLVFAIVGMLSYTGILRMGLPPVVMYGGFVVTLVGLAFLYLELHECRDLIAEEYMGRQNRYELSKLPDDGYCIDISGQDVEKDGEDSLFLTSFKDDGPTLVDLTKVR